eukprot:m.4518 g.4518  ORF g.4518 m.4518 type:complete len:209 (-) comp4334_c0_seq1:28-654(-)
MSQKNISAGTQSLVKAMMKDSKLTPFQQRQLQAQMEKGTSLPSKVNPTSSKPPAAATPSKPKPKAAEAGGGKRQLNAIVESGAYDQPEVVVPAPGVDREKERQKLHDVMAFGREAVEAKEAVRDRHARGLTRAAKPAAVVDTDMFDTIMEEIEERQRFLEQMERLGRGKEYRAQITTEISQKIRMLEVIDKERSAELHKIEAALKARA